MATAKEAALGGRGRDVDGDALAGGEVSLAVVSVSESLLLDERRAVAKEESAKGKTKKIIRITDKRVKRTDLAK